jgi:hypothetical protein
LSPDQPSEPEPATKPGKIRTWWHPLLASMLRWQLGSHYQLEEEIPVGQKPLQIDILLLRKEQGELPASARKILAGLVEYLGELTLLEFKSPSDTLRAGDFQTFLAYALLYRAQNQPLLEPCNLHLLVLAPRLTRPYREELRVLSVTAEAQERGVWRLQGGLMVHPTWVLETEELAGLDHPLLTLVSPILLKNRSATYDLFLQAGYTNMMVYMHQQIQQFRMSGEEFAMQHLGAEDELKQVLMDLWATMSTEQRLETLTPAEIQRLMATLPPEKRLVGLSEEEILAHTSIKKRLASIPPEEILSGLTPEQLKRLRLLLQQQPPAENDSSTPKQP